ncbi:hypothetical protein [Phycicoccus flavus]|uniref:hypothetical protein n=1 Tax=Phycicoccus flavus TaxID=2502783 RepID=UPI000FEB89B0|nr:hypothetical protein [Phycicoccus flavus]NHA69529.1 hypothetical protein [Phycicoccus flavus]
MPLGPDPQRAAAARARLDALRDVVAAAEDDLLACLVVTGEPGAQRVLDDWLDQAVDTLRAVGEAADKVTAALPAGAPGSTADGAAAPSAPVSGRGSWPGAER